MFDRQLLTVIIPSYNDHRIIHAIKSVRRFDDLNCVKLLIKDADSNNELIKEIKHMLKKSDILIVKKDKGIFDGLNQALDYVDTEYLGWIGSDDMFSGMVKSSDVISALNMSKIFVCNTAHFKGNRVSRISHSVFTKFGLVKLGVNNPHFSTFLHSNIAKTEKFNLSLRAADVIYFMNIFGKISNKNIVTSNSISTLMELGGYSTSSIFGSINAKIEIINNIDGFANRLLSICAISFVSVAKFLSKLKFLLFKENIKKYLVK